MLIWIYSPCILAELSVFICGLKQAEKHILRKDCRLKIIEMLRLELSWSALTGSAQSVSMKQF